MKSEIGNDGDEWKKRKTYQRARKVRNFRYEVVVASVATRVHDRLKGPEVRSRRYAGVASAIATRSQVLISGASTRLLQRKVKRRLRRA
jgi:hypothetical protein